MRPTMYSSRQPENGPRTTNLTLRMSYAELQALEDLAARYAQAKGTPRPGKTALIRMGIKRLMKSYPVNGS
jgi:hypothetical protein